MKNLKLLLLISFLTLLCCCRNDDCFTPPDPVVFEILDSTNQNIIANSTIDPSDIFIQENVGNGNSYGVQIKKTDDNKILLREIGYFNGTKDYTVYLALPNDVRKFNFSVQSSKRTQKCEGYKIDNISFMDVTATKENDFYKIVLQ